MNITELKKSKFKTVLVAVVTHGPTITDDQIADALGSSRRTASRLVAEMIKLGYLTSEGVTSKRQLTVTGSPL